MVQEREQGRMRLEGILREVDIDHDLNYRHIDRLYVLLEGDDGILYSTFIERNTEEDEAARRHLVQIWDTLSGEIISAQDEGRRNPRIAVTVVPASDYEAQQTYQAVSSYQIVRKN